MPLGEAGAEAVGEPCLELGNVTGHVSPLCLVGILGHQWKLLVTGNPFFLPLRGGCVVKVKTEEFLLSQSCSWVSLYGAWFSHPLLFISAKLLKFFFHFHPWKRWINPKLSNFHSSSAHILFFSLLFLCAPFSEVISKVCETKPACI